VTFRIDLDIADLLRRWAAWASRHRVAIPLFILALSAAALGFSASNLAIDTDSQEMIHPDEPFRVHARLRDELFPHIKNQILVIVRADSADQADYVTEALVERIRGRSETIRDVFAPAVNDFFQRQGLLFLELEDLIDTSTRLATAAPLLEKLIADPSMPQFFSQLASAARASEEGVDLGLVSVAYDEVARVVESVNAGDPAALSWQRMFGLAEGVNQRLIVVDPKLDFGSLQPARPAVETLRAMIAETAPEMRDGAEIHLTGDPVLRTEELQSVSQGIEISLAVSLLLVSLLLAFGLRSWQFVLACLASLLSGLALTTGFATLVFAELNLVSIAFAVLLIGLGIDFAIHLVLGYRERINAGADHDGALADTMREVGPALALAMLTTAVAFFAFVPTRFVGMAQLGVISGVGVIIAFFVSVTLIPALLALLPTVRPNRMRLRYAGRYSGVFRRCAVPVAIAAVVLGLGAAALTPQARFNADPMSLRDPDSPSVQAFKLLFERPQDTPYRVNYIAEDRQDALDFAERVEKLPLVHSAITLDDFVPDNQDLKLSEIDFLAGDLAFVLTETKELSGETIAEARRESGTPSEEIDELIAATERVIENEADSERGAAAKRLKVALETFRPDAADNPELNNELEHALLKFFPMQMERLRLQLTARPVTMQDLPEDVRRRYKAPSGEMRVEVLPAQDVRDPAARERFVDSIADLGGRLAGGAYAVIRAGEVVAESMIQATLTAFLLGALLIYAITRNRAFVSMVMAPLALAGLMTVATGVLIGLPFNFANVIVLPLLIGLGVDSAIHLVMRTQRMDQTASVFSTSTPRAVLLSALTTIGSFGSLALSDHRGTASMGELLTIALGYTLLATLVVLPGLMVLRERLRRSPPPSNDAENGRKA